MNDAHDNALTDRLARGRAKKAAQAQKDAATIPAEFDWLIGGTEDKPKPHRVKVKVLKREAVPDGQVLTIRWLDGGLITLDHSSYVLDQHEKGNAKW